MVDFKQINLCFENMSIDEKCMILSINDFKYSSSNFGLNFNINTILKHSNNLLYIRKLQ